jgi:hypothetical protein
MVESGITVPNVEGTANGCAQTPTRPIGHLIIRLHRTLALVHGEIQPLIPIPSFTTKTAIDLASGHCLRPAVIPQCIIGAEV